MKKENDLIVLGNIIRKLRKEKKFSQENFANHIGMNRGYYGTIERGCANVTALNLLKIARGLQVHFDDIFPYEVFVKNFSQ